MTLWATCAFFCGVALASLVSADDKAAKKSDSEAILGEWMVTYLEEEGEVAPPEMFKNIRLIFTEKKLLFKKDDKVVVESKYSLDACQDPKHIDMRLFQVDEKKRNDKEEEGLGIYKLEGDTLVLCVPGLARVKDRPNEFKVPKNSGLMLLKLERVKK